MLLEFSFINFKSFKDQAILSLRSNNKLKDIDYSILKTNVGKKTYSGLCSSVIYGPNASGKTSVICALDVLKRIILRGNILDLDENSMENPAASHLGLIPYSDGSYEPVSFGIKFINQHYLFEYQISIDIGSFMQPDYQRKVLFESLSVNDYLVFERKESDVNLFLSKLDRKLLNMDVDNSILEVAKNSLNDTDLFLTNGFKTIISNQITDLFTSWFRDKLVVICRADRVQSAFVPAYQINEKYIKFKSITEAAHVFGVADNDIGYASDKDGSYRLVSTVNLEDGRKITIPSDIYESFGTIRFINEFPIILSVFANGGTLLADELDASIHPMALINLINIFHNDDLNTEKAQLIFNTQNPVFLNGSIFRRDEIKFVERDTETQNSILYALSDFKTYGNSRARNSSNYMANYFINKYGAIKNIDFGPVFKDFMKNYGSKKKDK